MFFGRFRNFLIANLIMDTNLRAQIDAYLIQLESLILRGNGLRDRLAAQASDLSAIHDTRQWQEDCGIVPFKNNEERFV